MSSEVVSEEEDDDLIQTKRRKLESREEDELDEVESPRGVRIFPHAAFVFSITNETVVLRSIQIHTPRE